jgi:hypothetical protein
MEYVREHGVFVAFIAIGLLAGGLVIYLLWDRAQRAKGL